MAHCIIKLPLHVLHAFAITTIFLSHVVVSKGTKFDTISWKKH